MAKWIDKRAIISAGIFLVTLFISIVVVIGAHDLANDNTSLAQWMLLYVALPMAALLCFQMSLSYFKVTSTGNLLQIIVAAYVVLQTKLAFLGVPTLILIAAFIEIYAFGLLSMMASGIKTFKKSPAFIYAILGSFFLISPLLYIAYLLATFSFQMAL